MQNDGSQGQEVFPKITEFAAAMSPGDLQARSEWSTATRSQNKHSLFHYRVHMCTAKLSCMRVCIRACIYASLFLCLHACMHLCMDLRLHVNVCMHVQHVGMNACMCVMVSSGYCTTVPPLSTQVTIRPVFTIRVVFTV